MIRLSGDGARRRLVYLDHNATTRPSEAVAVAMAASMLEAWGNPSSSHALGSQAKSALVRARSQVAALLGARPAEIVFTSGATESNHTAILGALQLHPGKRHIVTSAVEHPSTLRLLAWLERQGVCVTYLPVDAQGRLDPAKIADAITPRTALLSLMWANNETGTLFPVEGLARLAHEAGALFHTDAVQAVGKVPIELKSTQIDFLSLSAHKLHGPKGVGALYVRKGTKFTPFMRGGHQERARRGGTENTPGIVGLGVAAELARSRMREDAVHVASLRDRLEQGVMQQIGRCRVSGDLDNRLVNTSNIAFSDIEGEAVLTHLDRAGIAASTGSACTAGSTEPSHVLRAMNLPDDALRGAIRFSFSRENTVEDVDDILRILPGVVAKLREITRASREREAQLLTE